MSDRALRATLAIGSLVALCVFVGALVYFPMRQQLGLSDTMIGVILGLLGGLVKDAYTYCFGTTANSTARQEVMMKAQANAATAATAPPTVPSP